MANAPSFAATVNNNAVTTNATADTSYTAPTNTATAFTAGANGSRVDMIRINQIITTTTSGIINVFLYDGTNYHFWDFYSYGTGTVSTTAQIGPIDLIYNNLVLKTGWSIRVTNTVASATGSTAAGFKIVVFGGDF